MGRVKRNKWDFLSRWGEGRGAVKGPIPSFLYPSKEMEIFFFFTLPLESLGPLRGHLNFHGGLYH